MDDEPLWDLATDSTFCNRHVKQASFTVKLKKTFGPSPHNSVYMSGNYSQTCKLLYGVNVNFSEDLQLDCNLLYIEIFLQLYMEF